MTTSSHPAASRRDLLDSVHVALPVLPSQHTGRLTSHIYAVLEAAGTDPAVPSLPSNHVTFPLEAHVNISSRRGHPRLQESVPDNPWQTPLPSIRGRGTNGVGKMNIDEGCQPRSQPRSAIVPRDVVQAEISSSQQGHWAWLDQQQSWLDWAEISFEKATDSASDESGDEINRNLALSKADQPMPDLESTAYSEDLAQARCQWGSDPAFTANNFIPPATQLSETEVTSIWNEYVIASLKPVVNALSANPPANHPLIVGNHDLDIDDVESASSRISGSLPIPFAADTNRPRNPENVNSSVTTGKRPPPPPFRGGRKRPMPPRVRPWLEQFSMYT